MKHILLSLGKYCCSVIVGVDPVLTNCNDCGILSIVIRLQQLEWPATGGAPAGTPFFAFEVV